MNCFFIEYLRIENYVFDLFEGLIFFFLFKYIFMDRRW